jgi:hypothetical protein
MTTEQGDGWWPCPCCNGEGGSNGGPLPPHAAEIARLRKIEEAAREALASYDATMHSLADEGDYQRRDHAVDALRASLGDER